MLIQRIRGRNLRSLVGDFSIDLTEGPLACTNLFAITGPTGSGKSTILDALSLALYGTTPRGMAGSAFVKIGNDNLSEQDERHALSRGMGEGYAEVDFKVRDKSYRARWTVYRARKKPDGNIQASRHELWDLDAGCGMAEKKSNVVSQIEEITDLSFPQFCRSVLLAQGEFAAFLLAKGEERASLLETITGIDIYGRLSMLAHERGRLAERMIKAAEADQRRMREMLLSEAQRAQLTADLVDVSRRIEILRGETDRVRGAIEWHERGKGLVALLGEAQTRHQEALLACKAFEPEREMLDRAQRAWSIKQELEADQAARREAQEALARVEAAKTALNGARLTLEAAREGLACSEAALAKERQAQEDSRPAMDEAIGLDQLLAKAGEQLEGLRQGAEAAKGKMELARKEEGRIKAEMANSRQLLGNAESWIDEREYLKPLAEQWERWEAALRRFATASAQERGAQGKEEAASKALAKAREAVEGLRLGAQRAQEALEEAELQDKACAESLEAHRQDHPHEAMAAWREAADLSARAIESMERTLGQASRAAQAMERSRQSLDQATGRQEVLLAKGEEAATREDSVRARLAEARRGLETLRVTLSLEGRRQSLVKGEPCPLCGSKEHPWAGESGPDQVNLGSLEKDAQALDDELRRLERERRAQEAEVAVLGERIEASKDALAQAERERGQALAEAAGDLGRLAEQVSRLPKGAPPLPDGPEGIDEDALMDLSAFAASQAKAAQAAQERERWLLDKREQARGAVDRARARATKTAQAAEGAQDEGKEAEEQAKEARRLQEEASSRAKEALREASEPFMDRPIPWEMQCRQDPEAFIDRCQIDVVDYRFNLSAVQAQRERLLELHPLEADATRGVRAAMEKAEEANRELALVGRQLKELEGRRMVLLGGQAVARVEQAWRERREALEANVAQGRERAEGAAGEMARAEEAHSQAMVQSQEASRRRQSRGELAAQALRERGLEEAEALELLRRSWTDIEAAALRGKELDLAASRTEALVAGRRKDLEAHQSSPGRPTGTHEQSLQEKANLDKEMEGKHKQRAEMEKGLEEDGRIQARLKEAEERLAVLVERTRLTIDLMSLIGHSKGTKFRSVAQAMTLDRLVRLANHRLATLAPRYQLRRVVEKGSPERERKENLELHVIDREQADAIRPITSLSGGETFLVSLALALALSKLSSRGTFIESFFIDEGFGALDSETLDTVLCTLESLQAEGIRVGVVSHVAELNERIMHQVRIDPLGGGQSRVRVLVRGGREEEASLGT